VLGVGSTLMKSTRAGCPWWHGSAKEERQWWSGGVAEGTGKEVRGAPGIVAELEAVMESSEEDRDGILWKLNDGGTTAQWRQWAEEEKDSSWGGALLLTAARGSGRGRRK
jgi:hypothetical protein